MDLQKKLLDEIRFQHGRCVLEVLSRSESNGKLTDDDVIVALEEKYDLLKDKLLTEALEKEVSMSEYYTM